MKRDEKTNTNNDSYMGFCNSSWNFKPIVMVQINLFSNIFKEFLKYLGWIFLFLFLWFHGCSKDKSVALVKAVTPEVKGVITAKRPIQTPIEMANKWPEKTSKSSSKQSLGTINTMIEMAKENEKLKLSFAKADDSIKKLKYDKSIQLNNFHTNFDDDNLNLNIDGIVRGEVQEITPSYTIKSKKVEVQVKQKETVFRLLVGGEIGNNTKLDGFAAKANLMFQNRKGDVISASFDTDQRIWIGYSFSILNIKGK